jgi:hypothetical protein
MQLASTFFQDGQQPMCQDLSDASVDLIHDEKKHVYMMCMFCLWFSL